MEINKGYPVITLKCLQTRYGKSILAVLRDGIIVFETFLPHKFSDVLKNENLADQDYSNMELVYHGRCTRTSACIITLQRTTSGDTDKERTGSRTQEQEPDSDWGKLIFSLFIF